MKGTILLQCPRRCTKHLSMIRIISLRNVFVFSTIDDQNVIYPSFFCIQFFKQCVDIALQHVLAFAIKKKILLAGNVCSKPPIIIKLHDLHVGDIKSAVGEIVSYHEKDQFSSFFGSYGLYIFWPFFGFPLLFSMRWFWPLVFIGFFSPIIKLWNVQAQVQVSNGIFQNVCNMQA